MRLIQKIRTALAVTCLATATSPFLSAQAQTDITTPTPWVWLTGASVAQVTAQANNGYRLVDIEVEDTVPFNLSASFVRNTGEYAKGWWWYLDKTVTEVNSLRIQNNARIIDVEPYTTPGGTRYAVIMIPNSGADFASDHGWQAGMLGSQVISWVNGNPTRRIIDLQVYTIGTTTRYAFVWITNTGVHQSPWWFYLGVSSGVIDSFLSQNNVRLIDLERNSNGGAYSAVMVPGDGDATYHLYNLTFGELVQHVSQFAARLIDLERYEVPSGARFVAVMRQNDNDLAIDANHAMREHLPLAAKSGLSMVRIDSSFVSVAGVQEDVIFEPASLMKTAHLFTSMQRVFNGLDSLAGSFTYFTGLSGSCPNGTALGSTTVSAALRRMMEQSSNADTEAIRARYGTNIIEAYADVVGAPDIELNHTIGCLCGNPRNKATLNDFARIHRYVAAGNIGSLESEFHDHMLNGSSFGSSAYNTTTILNAEIAASTLNNQEKTAFRNGLTFAHKGGSYTCSSGSENHRSIGAFVRIPFRTNCNTIFREYFIGAWVNDAPDGADASDSLGAGIAALWTDVLRDALDSWESAGCNPFQNYCTAVPNSTGLTGKAIAIGSPYIADGNFSNYASDLPQNVFCFLLVGTADDFVQAPAGSLGNLCIGGSIGRYWDALQSTGNGGDAWHPTSLNAIPKPNSAPVPVQAGETLYFQWWHRDTVNGAPASNFTVGLRTTFI